MHATSCPILHDGVFHLRHAQTPLDARYASKSAVLQQTARPFGISLIPFGRCPSATSFRNALLEIPRYAHASLVRLTLYVTVIRVVLHVQADGDCEREGVNGLRNAY